MVFHIKIDDIRAESIAFHQNGFYSSRNVGENVFVYVKLQA